MHWSILILIGAVANVLVNAGYKNLATKGDIFSMAACVLAVSSLTLFAYSYFSRTMKLADLGAGWTPAIIGGMGAGAAAVTVLFITALSKGPISIVDPLWACIYSLASVLLGVFLLREAPGLTAYMGIGLYLLGAFLMARG